MTITEIYCPNHSTSKLASGFISMTNYSGVITNQPVFGCIDPGCDVCYQGDSGYFRNEQGKTRIRIHEERCSCAEPPSFRLVTLWQGEAVWACPYTSCQIVRPFGARGMITIHPTQQVRLELQPDGSVAPVAVFAIKGLPPRTAASISKAADKWQIALQASEGANWAGEFPDLATALSALHVCVTAEQLPRQDS